VRTKLRKTFAAFLKQCRFGNGNTLFGKCPDLSLFGKCPDVFGKCPDIYPKNSQQIKLAFFPYSLSLMLDFSVGGT